MPDPTNHYRRPDKRKAYETALSITNWHSTTYLNTSGASRILTFILQKRHALTTRDAREIAFKALCVERGRRRKQCKLT